MRKIGMGIIGTGFIGPVHVEAVRRIGFADVVALAETSEPMARTKADQLGIDKAYGDYRRLLDDVSVDIVHIAVPNHKHYTIVKEALARGKHVVCEKPLAMTVAEGRELAQLAQESGRVSAVHLNCRAYPLVQGVKAMVEAGEMGRIFSVNGSYQQDWLFKETDYNWRLEPELSGTSRAVADIGTHWFDTIEYVTGMRVNRVCADLATFHPTRKKPLKPVETYANKILTATDYEDVPIKTEDYASVLLRFENGAHGSFTANQAAAGRKNRLYFEICGSKCSVAFDSERPNELLIGHRDGSNALMIKDPSLLHEAARGYCSYPGGHTEGFADTVKHTMLRIYSAIADGRTQGDFPNFFDGLRELELCDAIVQSSANEKWVSC